MNSSDIVLVRSGGDIASGIIQRLHNAGFRIIVLEIENPSSIRREVCFGEAVCRGEIEIEETKSRLAGNLEEAYEMLEQGIIPVIVDGKGETIGKIKPFALIDGILAKRNLGTSIDMAPITIGAGPGFYAGRDVDAVVETKRGHYLGKVIYEGEAIKNSGIPGNIGGFTEERVIYSDFEGTISNIGKIGDSVVKGQTIASIGGNEIRAKIDGVLRGIIRDGYYVTKGLKIADIDPRKEEYGHCFTISDKARSVGGGVLEALLTLMQKNNMKLENMLSRK